MSLLVMIVMLAASGAGCPTAAQVAERAAALAGHPVDATQVQVDLTSSDDDGGAVTQLTYRALDGGALASRRLAPLPTCAARLEAAAVLMAFWMGAQPPSVAPVATLPPAVRAVVPARPAPSTWWSIPLSVGGIFDTSAALVGRAGVEVGRGQWAVRAQIVGHGPRELAAGEGRVRWWGGGPTAEVVYRGSNEGQRTHALVHAGLGVARWAVEGRALPRGVASHAWAPFATAGLDVVHPFGPVALSLGPTVDVCLREQVAVSSDRSLRQGLPCWAVQLHVGVRFFGGQP